MNEKEWRDVITIIEFWVSHKDIFMSHKLVKADDKHPEFDNQSKTIKMISNIILKLFNGDYTLFEDGTILYKKAKYCEYNKINTKNILDFIEDFSERIRDKEWIVDEPYGVHLGFSSNNKISLLDFLLASFKSLDKSETKHERPIAYYLHEFDEYTKEINHENNS